MRVSLELQPCLREKSGISIYTYELAKELQRIPYIDASGNVFNFRDKKIIEDYIKDIKINFNICNKISYGVYRRIWNYIPIRYNSLFNNKSDIYHFFDFIVPPNIEGKVITTIHDLTFEYYPNMVEKKTLKRIKRDINYSIERADKIIAVSNSTKRDIINHFKVDGKKIEIVSPGVDVEIFAQSYNESQLNEIKNKYKLPDDYILYMGTLEPRKNIESIIRGFAELKRNKEFNNIKLVIAGKKGWLFKSIFELVEKLHLENEIIFTGYIDEKDKPIIYKMAKLFVFPSIYEGFGIPVLEAMASSIPVITSNMSSLPEVSGDAALLVSPKDTKAIAHYMKEVLTNDDLCRSLIKKGNKQAKKFTWEISAKKTYKIYEEIMNNK